MYNPNKISEILSKKDLSKADLSRGTGLSASTIGYILSYSGNPTADKMEKIPDFLDCSIEEFFERNTIYSNTYTANTKPVKIKAAKENDVIYESQYKDKYIQQLENENLRINEELMKKQELIESFLSGKVVVEKDKKTINDKTE